MLTCLQATFGNSPYRDQCLWAKVAEHNLENSAPTHIAAQQAQVPNGDERIGATAQQLLDSEPAFAPDTTAAATDRLQQLRAVYGADAGAAHPGAGPLTADAQHDAPAPAQPDANSTPRAQNQAVQDLTGDDGSPDVEVRPD